MLLAPDSADSCGPSPPAHAASIQQPSAIRIPMSRTRQVSTTQADTRVGHPARLPGHQAVPIPVRCYLGLRAARISADPRTISGMSVRMLCGGGATKVREHR